MAWRAAAFVFLLALGVRLAFVLSAGWRLDEADLTGDAPQYHSIAANLSSGRGYSLAWPGSGPFHGQLRPTAYRAPLWPSMLAVVYRITGSSPTAGRLFAVMLDALTCLFLTILAGLLDSPRTGSIVGVLSAIYPPMWLHVGTLWSEPLFTFTIVLLLFGAELYRTSPSLRRSTTVGMMLGLCALTRPTGLLLAGAFLWWVVWAGRALSAAQSLKLGVAAMLACIAVIFPWELRTTLRMKALVPIATLGGSVIAGGYSAATVDGTNSRWGTWDLGGQLVAYAKAWDETSFDREQYKVGVRWIGEHPVGAAKLIGLHAIRYFDLYWCGPNRVALEFPTRSSRLNAAAVVCWWLVAMLAVAGLVGVVRKRQLAAWLPSLAVWLALTLSGLLLAAGTRFRVPSDPVVLCLAAAHFNDALSRVRRAARTVNTCRRLRPCQK